MSIVPQSRDWSRARPNAVVSLGVGRALVLQPSLHCGALCGVPVSVSAGGECDAVHDWVSLGAPGAAAGLLPPVRAVASRSGDRLALLTSAGPAAGVSLIFDPAGVARRDSVEAHYER